MRRGGTLPSVPWLRPVREMGPEGRRRLDILLRVLAALPGGYALSALFATADHREGREAFLGKRKPAFEGR